MEFSPSTQEPTYFSRCHLDEALEYHMVDCMPACTNLLKLQKELFDPTKAIQSQRSRPFERDSPTRIVVGFFCCISEDLANDPDHSHARLSFASCILKSRLLWILLLMNSASIHQTRVFLVLHPCRPFPSKQQHQPPEKHHAVEINRRSNRIMQRLRHFSKRRCVAL
jgi:hypothetical protein